MEHDFIKVADDLPNQKDHVICFDGEMCYPAIYYRSMTRGDTECKGFFHFSTYYDTHKQNPYSECKTKNEHEIKGVISWYPMPTPKADPLFIEIGEKVHYCPTHGPRENGIIKSLNEYDPTVVFVVYKCADDWDNYKDYTGASTKIADLKSGWYE